MKTLILTASPVKDGLTEKCASVCAQALMEKGAAVDRIRLRDLNLQVCRACGKVGWGICREQHRCIIRDDDFESVHQAVLAADALIIVTPVYFWQMSEIAAVFMDRLRRCEAFNPESPMHGRRALMIAAAGGKGTGTQECLAQMDIYAHFLKLDVAGRIGVTRFDCEQRFPEMAEAALKLIP